MVNVRATVILRNLSSYVLSSFHSYKALRTFSIKIVPRNGVTRVLNKSEGIHGPARVDDDRGEGDVVDGHEVDVRLGLDDGAVVVVLVEEGLQVGDEDEDGEAEREKPVETLQEELGMMARVTR